jgi:gamma-glutamyltranspeptidase/glutathione hydrolase
MPHSPHGVNFEAHRPVVMARNGMVCSGHPLASQAGIATLQRGGNAVDAAIATAASLNVVEPLMSGIGGDGFIMVYWKDRDRIEVCNATGAAPYAATIERFARSPEGIPMKGILSASTPALLDGWLEAHQRYGSLPLADLLAPAVDLADNGFPVSHILAQAIASDPLLCRFPTSRAVFTRDGRPLRPGEILYQKDLARTFLAVIEGGRDAFYRGPIARAIVKFSEEQGGLLSLKDFADCRSRWQAPISTAYRGHTVYEAPPNSSGHVLLQELNLLEQFDVKSLGCNTSECIHLMVEAKKLAFADREAYVADPDFIDVPTEGLVSKEYARARSALIDPQRAAVTVRPGDPWLYQRRQLESGAPRAGAASGRVEEDTTCFVVVDRWGNAVCQLQSIQSAWGSSLIAGDTGILLNNRMTYWHLDEGHVDRLEPGKRVRHTMNPVMVFQEGKSPHPPFSKGGLGGIQGSLVLVCGTPGADTQMQTNLQVISHVLDFGMTVAEAVEAPRWRNTQSPTESTLPHVCDDLLYLESRFPPEVRSGLERRGHALNVLGPWDGRGSEMMIQVDPESGVLHGAADPRRDGYAIGW